MTGTETVTVLRDDLATLMSITAAGQWNRVDHPEIAEAWHRLTEAKDADLEAREAAQDAPLPPGEYARVEIMGHDSVTGWVSDGTRAGAPVMIVRDWDGRVVREVPGHALYQFFPLATPLRRPEPEPLTALPAGSYEGYYEADDEDQDAEPADAFAAHPEADF